jgi:Fic family protein
VLAEQNLTPRLRRENRIRTIQASLAIENNTLTLEQVTAVIEGRQVLGHPREIQEVRNAFSRAIEAMEGGTPVSRRICWQLTNC